VTGAVEGDCRRAVLFTAERDCLGRAADVAREAGVSVGRLQRMCRKHGVKWVSRPARLGCLVDRPAVLALVGEPGHKCPS